MLEPRRHGLVHGKAEMAPCRRHVNLFNLLDQTLIAATVFYELGYRHELQAVPVDKILKIGHAGHRTVVLHNLAAEPNLLKPGQTAEINRRLRVSRTLQHAALAGLQREHVPWPAEIFRLGVWIHARQRRHGAFFGRNARRCGDGINRHGECGLMVVGVGLNHLVEIKLAAPILRHGHAYEPLRMCRHEIHVGQCGETCGADAVALVLAILIIGNNNNLTARKRGETLLNTVEFLFQNGWYFTICRGLTEYIRY